MYADVYLGTIALFAFSRVPSGWHVCDGTLLTMIDNQALYSLMGTYYGGDGKRTFALPDLRGRVPVGDGQGSNLSNRVIGQQLGAEVVTLTPAHLPVHSHALVAAGKAPPTSPNATPSANLVLGVATGNNKPYVASTNSHKAEMMNTQSVQAAAGGQMPHNNLMPTFIGNYCIALQGLYPVQE